MHLDLCDVCFYIVYQQYTFVYCSDQLADRYECLFITILKISKYC